MFFCYASAVFEAKAIDRYQIADKGSRLRGPRASSPDNWVFLLALEYPNLHPFAHCFALIGSCRPQRTTFILSSHHFLLPLRQQVTRGPCPAIMALLHSGPACHEHQPNLFWLPMNRRAALPSKPPVIIPSLVLECPQSSLIPLSQQAINQSQTSIHPLAKLALADRTLALTHSSLMLMLLDMDQSPPVPKPAVPYSTLPAARPFLCCASAGVCACRQDRNY
jgi:hypothetical protein